MATNAVRPSSKELWDDKLQKQIFFRFFMSHICFSQVKMMTVGFTFTILPWLDRLYANDHEKYTEAMVRHQPFFNCTPETANFIVGLVCAMEGEYYDDPENFNPGSITALKAALMGPLSGVGDAIFWVAVRTIAATIAIGMANDGIAFAPIAFWLIYQSFSVPTRYFLSKYGYELGRGFLESAYESGYIEMLTQGAASIGMIMIGAMVANFVNLPTMLVLAGDPTSASRQTLQAILDSIFPKLLPLCATMLTFIAVRKNVGVIIIVLVMLAVGILGNWAGLLGNLPPIAK